MIIKKSIYYEAWDDTLSYPSKITIYFLGIPIYQKTISTTKTRSLAAKTNINDNTSTTQS